MSVLSHETHETMTRSVERMPSRRDHSSAPVQSSCWCVPLLCTRTGTADVIERFGKFDHVAQPGMHVVNPFLGYVHAGTVSMRVRRLDVLVEAKTLDNAFVEVVVSTQYAVLSHAVYESFYKLSSPESQLRGYVCDTVRSLVPKMTLNDLFLQKSDIANGVKDTLSTRMAEYGFSIISVLIEDVDPSDEVKLAMNGIVVAARRRTAAADKAEADKLTAIKVAEAEAEAKRLSGTGVALQREAIVEGLARSMDRLAAKGIDAKEVLSTLMATQYFDVLRDIGAHGKASTIFVPHGPAAAADAVRTGTMQALAALKDS